MDERFRGFALATLATWAVACVAEQPEDQSASRPDAAEDVMTEQPARDAAAPHARDAGRGVVDAGKHAPPAADGGEDIVTTAYECPADEDAGHDGSAEWPCAEPGGALEACVADAFACAPSGYGSVAVATDGTHIALLSVTRDAQAIFARFDHALRPLGMVSFPLDTGGYFFDGPLLAAHPGGWLLAYEAGLSGLHVLDISASGTRVRTIGTLDNGLPIRFAERPDGTPLLLVMRTISIDEARAFALAIADDLSSFSAITDLGEVSVRDGAFTGSGYLAVMDSQGPTSQTSLQRLALDGTPVGDAVVHGTNLHRFGLVAGDESTHFFYSSYSPQLQQGFVATVADDGTGIGEPRPLDPALNSEQGDSVLAWDGEHVMLQRDAAARLLRIDAAQQVTTLATLTAETDGIPIALVRAGDRAIAVIASQASAHHAITLAAVRP